MLLNLSDMVNMYGEIKFTVHIGADDNYLTGK
ncbi:hypothetical protein MNBD_NITROSPIRAE03-1301 [hydrothermal vent metagenome]|uniref:Uncharacterized protein n=1 Tax=hydrothermal vent metagenome TaxID=652676 RepID=A0A3B1DDL3_9ZZZZ